MFRNVLPVTRNIIITNIVVFLAVEFAKSFMGIELNTKLGLIYFGYPDFKIYQLITCMFMHGDYVHLAFNMMFLYTSGSMLEHLWGGQRYFIFYMLCGIGASLMHLMALAFIVYQDLGTFDITIFQESFVDPKVKLPSLGASGALFGLFAAFAALFPNAEFQILFIPKSFKAKYLFAFFVLMDVVLGVLNLSGDPLGHFAHIGGALTGLILAKTYYKHRFRRF
jgi:rhomboid-like protein